MIKSINLLPAALLAGAIMVTAWGVSGAREDASTTPTSTSAVSIDFSNERSWEAQNLERFDAESKPEKSIYLALVQLVDLERERGDVSAAVPVLKEVATRATLQQLRNAANRLLFEVAQETGDTAAARNHLLTIIEESLAQR